MAVPVRCWLKSALCLLQDISKEQVAGGFLTPAAAMETLIERLQNHAGLEFVDLTA